MATIPPSDEQKFLATLQECLQPDNEKRTAAEVRYKSSTTMHYAFIWLGYLSRDTRWTENYIINVNTTKYSVRFSGKPN